ncbi:hypothetical protein ACFPRL_21750 [Pseudoclavibacter helvolus]
MPAATPASSTTTARLAGEASTASSDRRRLSSRVTTAPTGTRRELARCSQASGRPLSSTASDHSEVCGSRLMIPATGSARGSAVRDASRKVSAR